MLSLKAKLKLDNNQTIKLETLSNEHRLLYNHLLSSIKDKPLTFKELNEEYKKFRNENNLTINSKSAQNTCISLINNIKSFYSLKKKDVTAKFPYKFKSHKYFKSFMLDFNNGNGGFKIDNNTLIINLLSKAIGSPKLIINLPDYCSNINSNNIKTITFKKEENNNSSDYYIIFVYSEQSSNLGLDKENFLSIDLGYSNLVTCYSNKIDNFSIKNYKQKKLNKTIEVLQSIKDKKIKNSKSFNKINGIFKKQKRKLINKQKDYHHKVSRKIIDICKENNIGSLIIGDLKVKKVISKENKKLSGISKSTLAISRFKTFLDYKSKKINMDHYNVNEAFTSQQNCLTGEIMFSSSLDNRVVEIRSGLLIDRDLNSAINIAKKVKGECLTQVLNEDNFRLNKMYFNTKLNVLEYEEAL